jgi:hypothetical protein
LGGWGCWPPSRAAIATTTNAAVNVLALRMVQSPERTKGEVCRAARGFVIGG